MKMEITALLMMYSQSAYQIKKKQIMIRNTHNADWKQKLGATQIVTASSTANGAQCQH